LQKEDLSLEIPHGERIGAFLQAGSVRSLGERCEQGAKGGIGADDLGLEIADHHGVGDCLEQRFQVISVRDRFVAQGRHLGELLLSRWVLGLKRITP
jgi:hypothetical protein